MRGGSPVADTLLTERPTWHYELLSDLMMSHVDMCSMRKSEFRIVSDREPTNFSAFICDWQVTSHE